MVIQGERDSFSGTFFTKTIKRGNSSKADADGGESALAKTFSDLIDVMDIAMWHLDLDYRVVGFNKKAKEIYGENALGHFCYSVAAKRDEVCEICPAKMVYDGGNSGRSEQKRIDVNGNEIYIDHIATPIKNKEGGITGTLVLIIDITRHKKQEKELLEHRVNLEEMVATRTKQLEDNQARYLALFEKSRRSEQLYRSLLESSADAIVIYNLVGEVQYLSPSFSKLFGWRLEELQGRKNPFVPDSEKESTLVEIRRLLTSGEPTQNFQTKRYTKDGRLLDIYLSASRYDDNEGKPSGLLVILKDVTDRKAMEKQLQQAQKMELVGQLAGGVAHDFNNMLGVILGHADLAMLQVDSSQPIYSNLVEIHKAANRSADITRQLLAFARKQTVVPKVIDLNETVEKMLKMMGRLVGEDIDLVWKPEAGLWSVRVDPVQIDQILANLCVNARHAISGNGRIVVETGNSTLEKEDCQADAGFLPGEYVRIVVSDNGHGMDKKTLSSIFEPFFTTKDVGKGIGLGLATVYGAVRQNNGFITACSEPGQGSSFTIYLPRHTGKVETPPTEKTVESSLPQHGTILLTEDEPAILKMTSTMLKNLGYTVLAADSPSEAIRLASEAEGEINLLLTDVIMPEMNGLALAKRLVSLQPGMKWLFMSGHTANIITDHGVLDDGVCFIQKPFSQKELAAKVLEALGGLQQR